MFVFREVPCELECGRRNFHGRDELCSVGKISQGSLAGNISKAEQERQDSVFFKIKCNSSLPFGMKYLEAAKPPTGSLIIHHQRKMY